MDEDGLPFALDAGPAEPVCPGLMFQWLFNRLCLSFKAEHTSRALVDAWVDKVASIAKTWPIDRPFFSLNDFSGKECYVTPYNRQKNLELIRSFPELRVIAAMVVQHNLTMQLSRLFVRALNNKRITVHIVFSRREALLWLKAHIDDYERSRSTLAQ